ncbi:MAG TPA: TraR/DksA family transcriptional regulator [Bryobacteraceae bacterium]|nr:TraR/DksA family transcriptional regulator [Bryobacteraceae bacterium]
MTERVVSEYKRMLLVKAEELRAGLAHRDQITVERSADQLDEIQRAIEREVIIRNLDSQAMVLRSVTAALSRSDDGSFGVCIRCEAEISPKRLAAVPWAAYCIECQEIVDRETLAGEETSELQTV